MRVSTAGLYDDARFPGRCLLVLDEHHDDLLDVPSELMSAYLADLRDLRDAIRNVTGAQRVNYAALGNAEPHVHWHVVPRRPDTEPQPGRSPWQDPRPQTRLPRGEREDLARTLRARLRPDFPSLSCHAPRPRRVVRRGDRPL